MKKSLLALAALASVASVAHAEDGVQLYGIIDVGVAQLTNTSDFNPTFVTGAVPTGNLATAKNVGTALGMMNGGQSATRWGIKGSEDLGQGRKVGFTLESGFSVATGALATSGLAGSSSILQGADTSLNGQLFGRQAHLDLSDAYLGNFQIGRVYNLDADIISAGYDPVNFQMFSPINFSGNYGGGGLTDNFRIDNSIKYNKKFGNYSVNALYSLGGRSNSYTAGSSEQISAGYENGRLGAQIGYQYSHDVTNTSTPATLTTGAIYNSTTAGSLTVNSGVPVPNAVAVKFYDLRALLLATKYKLNDKVSLFAGYELQQYMAPSNYASDSQLTQVYSYTVVSTSQGANKTNNVFWLGANYDLTPRTKLSAGYYYIAQLPGNAVASTTNASYSLAGSDRYASVAAEYYLSKRTNFYVAVMNDTKTGGAASYVEGAGPTTFNVYGVGVRTKF